MAMSVATTGCERIQRVRAALGNYLLVEALKGGNVNNDKAGKAVK
jgi:hypothetical protein